jgi:hypothetical protein
MMSNGRIGEEGEEGCRRRRELNTRDFQLVTMHVFDGVGEEENWTKERERERERGKMKEKRFPGIKRESEEHGGEQ